MNSQADQSTPDLPCLIYCIFETARGELQRWPFFGVPVGVEMRPVYVLEHRGLGVAVSRISVQSSEKGPDISDLMAYAKVIEAVHRNRAVLPMRYGCLLPDEAGVIELLRQQLQGYRATLRELDGCVEMGIRIMAEESSDRRQPVVFPGPVRYSSGTAYLQTRRHYYAEREQASRTAAALAARCRGAFDGLFVQCKTELSQDANVPYFMPLLSLYFLVKKECLEGFRQTFQALDRREFSRMLLNGPWPPFNFVPPGQPDRDRYERWTAG